MYFWTCVVAMETNQLPWQHMETNQLPWQRCCIMYQSPSKWQWVYNSCVDDKSWTVWPIFFKLGTLSQDTSMKNCIDCEWPWATESRSNCLTSIVGLWVTTNLACIQYWYQLVRTFVWTNRYQLNIWLTHKVVTLTTESLINDLDQIGNMHMFFLLVLSYILIL